MPRETNVGGINNICFYTISSGDKSATPVYQAKKITNIPRTGSIKTGNLQFTISNEAEDEAFTTFIGTYASTGEPVEVSSTYIDGDEDKSFSLPASATRLLMLYLAPALGGKQKATLLNCFVQSSPGAISANTAVSNDIIVTSVPASTAISITALDTTIDPDSAIDYTSGDLEIALDAVGVETHLALA